MSGQLVTMRRGYKALSGHMDRAFQAGERRDLATEAWRRYFDTKPGTAAAAAALAEARRVDGAQVCGDDDE